MAKHCIIGRHATGALALLQVGVPLTANALWSTVGVSCPFAQQKQRQRHFSEAAATAAAPASTAAVVDKPVPVFKYAKAKDLFERITAQLHTADEVSALQQEMYSILGRPLRENEFYHDGFGSRRVKGGRGSAGGAEDDTAPPVEAKTIFDVKLMGFDAAAKIKVIKEVRAMAGLGLKEAKELVESAPAILQKGVKLEQAEEIKAKLIELGAQVDLV
jgi:ribosomal protein L7/L12